MAVVTENAVTASDLAFLAVGAGAAGLYLAVLWGSVVAFVARGSAAAMIVGMIIRLGLLAGFAVGAVHIVPGLRALAFLMAGFLLVRLVVFRTMRPPEMIGGSDGPGRA